MVVFRGGLEKVLFNKRRPYSVTYLGTILYSTGSTITGSLNIGELNKYKEIFILSTVLGSSSPRLLAASSTVDGIVVTAATTSLGATTTDLAAAFVSVPRSAGSVTITTTYSNTVTAGNISVYKVINRPFFGSNEFSGGSANAASGTTSTLSATVIPGNGLWFAVHGHSNNGATTPPSGTTQDSDLATGSVQFAHGSRVIQSSGSTPTDVWSWTGSVANRSVSWAFY